MPQNSIIGLSGMRGHGKSTLLRKSLSDQPRVLVIDTLGEHQKGEDHAGWTKPLEGNIGNNIDSIVAGRFSRATVLLPVDEEEQQASFLYYCRAVYAAARRLKETITLVVEEIDWYSQPGWENEGLKLIIQYGRHGPVNLVWTARNIGSVSRKLTSETNHYFLFHVQEPIWIDAMVKRLGANVAEAVMNLCNKRPYVNGKLDCPPSGPPFDFVVANNSGQIIREDNVSP